MTMMTTLRLSMKYSNVLTPKKNRDSVKANNRICCTLMINIHFQKQIKKKRNKETLYSKYLRKQRVVSFS